MHLPPSPTLAQPTRVRATAVALCRIAAHGVEGGQRLEGEGDEGACRMRGGCRSCGVGGRCGCCVGGCRGCGGRGAQHVGQQVGPHAGGEEQRLQGAHAVQQPLLVRGACVCRERSIVMIVRNFEYAGEGWQGGGRGGGGRQWLLSMSGTPCCEAGACGLGNGREGRRELCLRALGPQCMHGHAAHPPLMPVQTHTQMHAHNTTHMQSTCTFL